MVACVTGWLVGLALVCAFVCAFVSAFVCSFRGLFACVLSWVEILECMHDSLNLSWVFPVSGAVRNVPE